MATPIRLSLVLLVCLLLIHPLHSRAAGGDGEECSTDRVEKCYNRARSLKLKLVAITSILVASMIGVCLPLFSRTIPCLRPDHDMFVVVKAFASGVILATGFMHVLPESFEMLTSKCLPEKPWQEFSFTAFIAMLSTLVTLMLDSFMLTFQSRRLKSRSSDQVFDHASPISNEESLQQTSGREDNLAPIPTESTLLRYRIIAEVLELGIIVHSVVIGLSLGASQSPCTIRTLVVALCFHQLFEGIGLGGCILQAEFKFKMKAIMVFFFSTTTPFGIVLGIGLSNVYSDNSPSALLVIGVLNASSAGLLIYMALVDLLAADFLGPTLQGKAKLQMWAYIAVLLGAGGMSLMAKWA